MNQRKKINYFEKKWLEMALILSKKEAEGSLHDQVHDQLTWLKHQINHCKEENEDCRELEKKFQEVMEYFKKKLEFSQKKKKMKK